MKWGGWFSDLALRWCLALFVCHHIHSRYLSFQPADNPKAGVEFCWTVSPCFFRTCSKYSKLSTLLCNHEYSLNNSSDILAFFLLGLLCLNQNENRWHCISTHEFLGELKNSMVSCSVHLWPPGHFKQLITNRAVAIPDTTKTIWDVATIVCCSKWLNRVVGFNTT